VICSPDAIATVTDVVICSGDLADGDRVKATSLCIVEFMVR